MEKRPEGDLTYEDKIEQLKSIFGDEVSVDIELLQARVIDELYDSYVIHGYSPVVVDKTCEEELRQDFIKEKAEVDESQKAKADAGKAEIRLVPMEIVWAIAWIRMYGNRKYGDPENWKLVEPERYRDALMRHLLAYISDPKSVDGESGYPHLWHAACNLAFLMHFDYGEEVLHDPNKTV